MKNYFRATPNNPFHLSIGAIIFNNDYSKVLCHYIKKIGHVTDIYVLMRESIEPNETFADALFRGAKEEFGAEIEVLDFAGTILSVDKWFGEIDKETEVEKTTLYFVCKLINQDNSKRVDDNTAESKSKLVWLTPDDLISKQKEQFEKYGVTNIDERKV